MKLFLYLTTSVLTFLVINGKKIKIQIESEDVLKLFDGVINSETLRNFAQQLAERGVSKRGVRNPYHPEDDLVNKFDTLLDKEQRPPLQSGKHPFVIDLNHPLRGLQNIKKDIDINYHNAVDRIAESTKDPLDQENEQFLNGNEVSNDDILTEIEMPLNTLEVKAKNDTVNEKDVTKKPIKLKKEKNKKTDMKRIILTRKDDNDKPLELLDDRSNFKPIQKRFVLKKQSVSTDDTPFQPNI